MGKKTEDFVCANTLFPELCQTLSAELEKETATSVMQQIGTFYRKKEENSNG